MKTVIKLSLMAAVCLMAFRCVFGDSQIVDGITWTYEVIDGKVTLGSKTACVSAIPKSTEGSVTIPSSLGGHPVIGIGWSAFEGCNFMTSVTMPDGIASIGSYAFNSCKRLVEVNLPSSVTKIDACAFGQCSSLKSITIPANVTNIGEMAFSGCVKLGRVEVLSHAVYFGENVFSGCDQVKEVVVPGYKCGIDFTVVSNLTVTSGTTEIGACAFSGCRALTRVNIPASVETVAENAFQGCDAITTVVLPGWKCQIDFGSVTNLTIADGTVRIRDKAFAGCRNLEVLRISRDVAELGENSFADCSNLETVLFDGDAPTIMSSSAFLNCPATLWVRTDSSGWGVSIPGVLNGSKIVYYTEKVEDGGPYTNVIDGVSWMFTVGNGTACVGSSLNGGFRAIPRETIGDITVPQMLGGCPVTEISDFAFDSCRYLTRITILDAVEKIGEKAFLNCAISGISVGSGNKSFSNLNGDGMLYSDSFFYLVRCPEGKLGRVDVPDCVRVIRRCAFENCSVTNVMLHKGLSAIERFAFNGSKVTSVSLPASVATIEERAFWQCDNMTSIDVAGDNGFFSSLNGVLFDKSMQTLICCPGGKTGAFSFPCTPQCIDDYAFGGCRKMTAISIPSGVVRIGSFAFHNCEGLTAISIPATVTDIGESAFVNCLNLASVDFQGPPPTGVTGACLPTDVAIRYNESYADQWLPVFADGGFSKVTPYNGGLPDGGPYTNEVNGVSWRFVVRNGCACVGCDGKTGIAAIPHETSGDVTVPTTLGDRPVTKIAGRAFDGCDKVTRISLSGLVLEIADDAFDNCGVAEINVDSANRSYRSRDGLLYDYGLTKLVRCPLGKTSSIDLPASLETIGTHAFAFCDLVGVILHEGVKRIEDEAFLGSTLKSVELPSSVLFIGKNAFGQCDDLTSIAVADGNLAYRTQSGVLYDKAMHRLVCCPAGKRDEVLIPDSVDSIEDLAFCDCRRLTKVIIPDGVTTIGVAAFRNCSVEEGIDFEGPPPNGLSFAEVSQDAAIRYNDLYGNLWPQVLETCGFVNATSYRLQIDEGGPYTNVVDGVSWVFMVHDGNAWIGDDFSVQSAIPANMASELTIPATLGNRSVVGIERGAFQNCSKLTRVTIPEGVLSIGERAFSGCFKMEGVTIPSSVTNVGGSAFSGCTSLKAVTIPVGVENIDARAFADCSMLSDVVIPDSVNAIGDYAFDGCAGFGSGIVIRDGWILCVNGECPNKVEVPVGTKGIVGGAFEGHDELTDISLPEGLKYIGGRAFSQCDGLTSVTIPPSVTCIGRRAFIFCANLTNVGIRACVLDFGAEVFYGCIRLADVEISEGTKCVGEEAFGNCSSLKRVAVPASVTNIGSRAFRGCNKEVTFDFHGAPPVGLSGADVPSGAIIRYSACHETAWSAAIVSCGFTNATAYSFALPDGGPYTNVVDGVSWVFSVKDGKASIGAGSYKSAIPKDTGGDLVVPSVLGGCPVTTVGDYAFYQCMDLTSVTIPNCVTSIGYEAFGWCENLTSVVIPEGVTNIGEFAFFACKKLSGLTLPTSVDSIGAFAFYACWALGDGLVIQDDWVLTYNHYDGEGSHIEIPTGVKRIVGAAFYEGWTAVETVTIPDSVVSIGAHAFYCCKLQSVAIPASVVEIGEKAFHFCYYLEHVEFNPRECVIGNDVFEGCSELSSLAFSGLPPVGVGNASVPADAAIRYRLEYEDEWLPVIAAFGFTDARARSDGVLYDRDLSTLICCPGGKDGCVVVSDGVGRIEELAFFDCHALTYVTMSSNVTEIGGFAFAQCSGLETMTFLGNAPSVSTSTFSGVPSSCKVCINRGTTGWDDDADGKWQGFEIAYLEDIPALGENPTAEEIGDALAGTKDAKVKEHITDKTQYNAYRAWAYTVKGTDGVSVAGAYAVKQSPTAWVSYALGSETLLAIPPVDDDLTVEAFEPKSGEDGKFDFTVSVKNIEVGGAAQTEAQREQVKENLKQVLGLEGTTSLDDNTKPFSSANVDITFGVPEDGKVKFTAGPKDAGAKTFFMKVKVK